MGESRPTLTAAGVRDQLIVVTTQLGFERKGRTMPEFMTDWPFLIGMFVALLRNL
jgi:hypothetical protein